MRVPIGYEADRCPVGYAFKAIEGKWKMPALYMLCVNGTMRYNELKRALNITNMMLTNTLRELEEFGLVSRTQYNEIPPRVEYSLLEMGKELMPIIDAFGVWGERLMKANQANDAAEGKADDR